MDPRFVTKTMHAYLDYPVAFSLMALPFLLDSAHPIRWRSGLPSQPASRRWC